MDNKNNPMWYAIYTSPRAEKQVKARLDAMGVINWLPLHSTPRVWSDRVKIVEVPLFNSYLFVCCKETELRDLLKVYGVCRIVYHSGKPAIIREKEIIAIKEFLEKAAHHTLCAGEEVEILCGPLKNISGKIKKIKKNYLVLHLEQLEATICVKLDEVASLKRMK